MPYTLMPIKNSHANHSQYRLMFAFAVNTPSGLKAKKMNCLFNAPIIFSITLKISRIERLFFAQF